jgi:hypothetical protein
MDLYKIVNMELFSNNVPETDETKDRSALSSEKPLHRGKYCKGGGKAVP